jgi:hypothetical protein
MAVTGTLIQPHGVTRVFFDCRNAAADAADRRRVEEAIEESIVLARAEDPPHDETAMPVSEFSDFVMYWQPVIARRA